MEDLKIGNFTYNKDDQGNWVYKADKITPFKKNGNLKAQYKDLPRFKAIVQYENQEVKDFQNSLEQSIKDVSLKLISLTR